MTQMKLIVSRLLESQSVLPRLSSLVSYRNMRLFSSDSNHIDKPFKVEEAETTHVPPPPSEKEASLYLIHSKCVKWSYFSDTWPTTDLDLMLNNCSFGDHISCVGGFGSNSHMFKINGTANINAIRAAAEQGVKRFVYISAADFGVANYLLQGYYEGKKAAEAELLAKFPYGGVILRPGFIHGTRQVGSMKIPLGVVGSPLEMILQHAKPLNRIPLVGPLFTPPVNVTSVSKVAVRAATDIVFPPGIVDVYGILRYSQQK
ncbi:Uncharacterized protein QJS10_CPB17g00482 [Acorus calamus]|uniref:NAD(P)-binding domain-containing protein n=1 Tax=Acorus calamus TaxID=4465 RepID=A0AAV9CVD4_ACOCL|nr:Uncharacterized protein QJS10_CPB17g00482 [Acorus calamus]